MSIKINFGKIKIWVMIISKPLQYFKALLARLRICGLHPLQKDKTTPSCQKSVLVMTLNCI